jgi:hypothetical protein
MDVLDTMPRYHFQAKTVRIPESVEALARAALPQVADD